MRARKTPTQEQKISEILEVIHNIAFGDLDARTSPGDQGDDIDAIMTGLNMLAEELAARVAAIEESNQLLQQSEARFKAVFQNAMTGIIVARASDHSIYMVNDAICNMLGYERKEILTKPITILHHPDDHHMILQSFSRVLERDTNFHADIPMLRKDGSNIFAEATSSTMQLQDERYVLGMFKDVTDRKSMELELEKLYREHHAITDSVPDILYRLDTRGNSPGGIKPSQRRPACRRMISLIVTH